VEVVGLKQAPAAQVVLAAVETAKPARQAIPVRLTQVVVEAAEVFRLMVELAVPVS